MDEDKIKALQDDIIKLASEKVRSSLENEYKGLIEGLREEIKKLGQQNDNLSAELAKMRTMPANGKKETISVSDLVHKAIGQEKYCVTKADSLSSLIGESGGILIPQETYSDIQGMKINMAEIVKPRAMVIPAGGPAPDQPLLVPARGQTDDGKLSRVGFNHRQEGNESTKTDFKLRGIELQPRIQSAYIDVPNTLIGNVPGMNALVSRMLREGEIIRNDELFINGTGVSEPAGILQHPAKLLVKRDTASSVKYKDITAMMGKMMPYSMPFAVWVASFSLYDQLANMVDPGNHLVLNQGDITKELPMTLLGRPVLWSEECSVLGTTGDLLLADFSYYLIKEGSGPFLASSREFKFTSQMTVILYEWNIDGKPWLKMPILMKDGVTKVSPFVALD